MVISNISPLMAPEAPKVTQSLHSGGLNRIDGAQKSSKSFQDTMTQALSHVNKTQQSSDDLLKGLASGQHVDLHGTMISLEKADISLRAMVSVRDKVLAAYEQVMNMTL
jgi:flagellar hook-basal body complex protein FliE